MIFITSIIKLHLFENFWTFRTQYTEYDYKCVEHCIYRKLKEAVEIYKNQTENHSDLEKILHSTCIVFASFGNPVYALYDYQLIQVSSSS